MKKLLSSIIFLLIQTTHNVFMGEKSECKDISTFLTNFQHKFNLKNFDHSQIHCEFQTELIKPGVMKKHYELSIYGCKAKGIVNIVITNKNKNKPQPNINDADGNLLLTIYDQVVSCLPS